MTLFARGDSGRRKKRQARDLTSEQKVEQALREKAERGDVAAARP
jgi:hypothetical protein